MKCCVKCCASSMDVCPILWGSLEWGVGVKCCAKYVGWGVGVKGGRCVPHIAGELGMGWRC